VDCAETADTPTRTPSAVAALIESTFNMTASPTLDGGVARHRDASAPTRAQMRGSGRKGLHKLTNTNISNGFLVFAGKLFRTQQIGDQPAELALSIIFVPDMQRPRRIVSPGRPRRHISRFCGCSPWLCPCLVEEDQRRHDGPRRARWRLPARA